MIYFCSTPTYQVRELCYNRRINQTCQFIAHQNHQQNDRSIHTSNLHVPRKQQKSSLRSHSLRESETHRPAHQPAAATAAPSTTAGKVERGRRAIHLYVNALTATQQSGCNGFGTVPFSGVEGADLSYIRTFPPKMSFFPRYSNKRKKNRRIRT